jgi:predicted metalloprotease with PDZ domain
MSKSIPIFHWLLAIVLLCLWGAPNLTAQGFDAEISVDASRSIAVVRGRFSSVEINHVNLSFAASVAGHTDIARRIRGVEIFDQRGAPVAFRKLIDSEYLAESGISSWKYELDLSPLKDMNAAAHTSWISGDKGLLMLADVLPTTETSGRVTLRVPATWAVFTTEAAEGGNVFNVRDSWRAVFAIGRGWQTVQLRDPDPSIDLLVSGRWNFTPAEAAAMAREIFLALRNVFGDDGNNQRLIILSDFPTKTSAGQWQAETRGSNVTVISSDMPFRTQSLQRLHEQLRHELFHLWIPNGVNLTGNYDWFYEGFALYESLKLAVALNRIRFEDFLDTLSRAHTIDSAQSQRTSLIQASNTRFEGSNTQIYSRGMLVAFLCDLALLEQSKRKRSVENVLTELFEKYRKPVRSADRNRAVLEWLRNPKKISIVDRSDGNTAVLELLRTNPKMISIVDKYITGSQKIEWASDLAAAGIEDSDAGPITNLRVKEKLNGRQKTLLDKLGYNNWRKLSPTSK